MQQNHIACYNSIEKMMSAGHEPHEGIVAYPGIGSHERKIIAIEPSNAVTTHGIVSTCSDLRERERIENIMSFTGVVNCSDGIVAFGDSRSTQYISGQPVLQNDDTRKVFNLHGFVMTASGNNTVIIDKRHEIRMEDYIGQHTNKFSTPLEFIDMFSGVYMPLNAHYYFCFGEKKDNHYSICAFEISNDGIIYHPSITRTNSAYNDNTGAFASDLREVCNSSQALTTAQAEKIIRKIIETNVRRMEELKLYCPVDTLIQIEILK